jgi:RNA polymerase sigma factor (sigma-70 family)
MSLALMTQGDATRAENTKAALMPTDPDAMLVGAARNGKPAAFEELIGRYEGRIFRLAQNLTQNREDAEEVTQEAFFRAFTHLEGFKGDSRFSTWLTRIAINEALMKLRRRRPTVSLDGERDRSRYSRNRGLGPFSRTAVLTAGAATHSERSDGAAESRPAARDSATRRGRVFDRGNSADPGLVGFSSEIAFPSRAHNAPRAVEPLLSTTEITRDQICETFSGLLNLTRGAQFSTDGGVK